jgi:hypothetical protein
VRTTLTLDEDVAAKLQAEAKATGLPFRQVVNDALRRGFLAKRPPGERRPFVLPSFDLGGVRAGINLDNVEELIGDLDAGRYG